MKKMLWGLFWVMVVASICGCSSEEYVNYDSQVTYAEVHVDFFQKTMTAFSKPATRASEDDNAKLKNCFKRLDVAFIPSRKVLSLNQDTIYSFSQISTQDDFGKVSVKLPVGKYVMVAIASNADTAVAIKTDKMVTFPNNKVTDMAYAYQEIELGKDGTTIDGSMTRAVAKFFLKATDFKGATVTTLKITCQGKCNITFDPSSGFAVDAKDYTYARTINIENIRLDVKPTITLYVLPVATGEKFTINIFLYDKDGNELKKLQFDKVPLEKNYVTTYTGNLFSTAAGGTFGISVSDFMSMGDDISFD